MTTSSMCTVWSMVFWRPTESPLLQAHVRHLTYWRMFLSLQEAQAHQYVTCVLHAAGGSGRLGTTGLDNTLVISELTQPLPRLSERLVSTQLQRRAPLAMRTALTLAAIDISIVDHMPEELLLLYAASVHASSELNVGTAARFSRASLTIGRIQVLN